MKYVHVLIVLVGIAATIGCFGPNPNPESCDLDTTFSESKQNVNCVESKYDPGQFTCTCPSRFFFESAETCDKTAAEQGQLIDSACPVDEDDNAAFG